MFLFARGSTLVLLLGDFAVLASSLVVTLFLRYQALPSDQIVQQHLQAFFLLFILWIVIFLITGLYDRNLFFLRKSIPVLVLRVQFVNILLAALFFFVFPFGIAPKTNLVIYLGVSTILIVMWRLYIFPLLTSRRPIKALVVGSSDEAFMIARVFAANPFFKNIKAFVLRQDEFSTFVEFQSSLLRFVREDGADVVIADMRDEQVRQLVTDFYTLAFENRSMRFFSLSSMYEELHHRVPPELVGDDWFLENVTTGSPHYAYDVVKRAIDIAGSLILLVPAAVLLPFVALAIWLQDRGPILYRAERVGQYNLPITLFKFRTMTGSDRPGDALQSTLRVTRVGKFLRRTRIDELPQLLNVLRGDLSFIGPRPEIPTLAAVYAEHIPYYHMRHLVKPGLSGWAQINNYDVPRQGVDIPRTIDKLSFDFYYLKHRSLLLDLEIALKTINTLLLRTGS
ncbi:exopolysaccharide biosynthesis polyprenyl glycosylphosphotransferase [Candidatus Kaiserbacteria bacterium]|nr:exopolysaccharide biosynthesis polyprenyl glycosylphosphotransferase [Candidatus Kaiserbacteria bacterium]